VRAGVPTARRERHVDAADVVGKVVHRAGDLLLDVVADGGGDLQAAALDHDLDGRGGLAVGRGFAMAWSRGRRSGVRSGWLLIAARRRRQRQWHFLRKPTAAAAHQEITPTPARPPLHTLAGVALVAGQIVRCRPRAARGAGRTTAGRGRALRAVEARTRELDARSAIDRLEEH